MPSDTESPRPAGRGRPGRRPPAQRHPPARAHPRRYRARPGGGRRLRPGRAHPADLDPVPPRQRHAGPARAGTDPRQHVDQPDRADRARLQLFLAPRQHRRGPEQHPPDAGADRAGRDAARQPAEPDAGACARGRHQLGRSAPLLRDRPGQPGADGASDRSSPQEHHGPRDGDRGAAGSPRARAAHAGRGCGRGRAAPPRGGDVVADQFAAPDQAHRAGRGRQRAVVLRLHFPARGAAAALRAGGPAERGRRRGARRTGLIPQDGKLDRRRPRRQSVRDGRRHARHAETAREPGAALLSGRAARAWRRAVDGRASHRHLQGSARARRALARQVAASQRRTLSAGGFRHFRAADGDRRAAGGGNHARRRRRGRTLRQCGGTQDRSRHPLPLAVFKQCRRDRPRPAAAVAPRSGLLRLPSRKPRHPPELRRA